jgi:hypothetical protein
MAAGIALYPGSSKTGVEGSEKFLRDSGYAQATCRRTGDSLAKVVAYYQKDKRLQLVGALGPGDDNATLSGPAGVAIVVNNPWMDMATLQSKKETMICIASRNGR